MTKKDSYYKESEEGVDAVLERLMKVLRNPPGSYAMALDVSENTVKSWRQRGEVSTKYLKGFAKQHNVSLDYLMRGEKSPPEEVRAAALTPSQERAGYSVEVLSKDEQALLDNYRNSPQEGKHSLRRAALCTRNSPRKRGPSPPEPIRFPSRYE